MSRQINSDQAFLFVKKNNLGPFGDWGDIRFFNRMMTGYISEKTGLKRSRILLDLISVPDQFFK